MSKIAEKLKTVNIPKIEKNYHSRDTILKKCNVGFEPKYQLKTEGIGRSLQDWKDSNRRYGKNYMNAKGLCAACPHFNPEKKNTITGEHCRLDFSESCCQNEKILGKKIK